MKKSFEDLLAYSILKIKGLLKASVMASVKKQLYRFLDNLKAMEAHRKTLKFWQFAEATLLHFQIKDIKEQILGLLSAAVRYAVKAGI